MNVKRIDGKSVNGRRQLLAGKIPLSVPYVVTMFPIYACNFKCRYCIHSNVSSGGIIVRDKRMLWPIYERSIHEIKKMTTLHGKLRVLHFIGYGEPLLHPEIGKMIKYATEQEVADSIDILTNGALLTKSLSDELIAAGLTKLRISVQGVSAKAYKEISDVDLDFQKFCENIEYFYQHRGSTKLHIKIIDIHLSDDEKGEFERIFAPMADTIAIEQLVPVIPRLHVENLRTGDKQSDFRKTVAGNETDEIEICPQIFYHLQIYPDGEVVPCCAETVPIHLGNIQDCSLQEIWSGQAIHELWKNHLLREKEKYPACAKCTQYKYSIFPEDVIDHEADKILARCHGMGILQRV